MFRQDVPHPIMISYWWQPPAPRGHPPNQPIEIIRQEQLRLPRIGQIVSWLLPRPHAHGQETPPVIAYGRVVALEQIEPNQYTAQVQRSHSQMSYDELCAGIYGQVVGYHPQLGCVEGRLEGLLPTCELAGISDPQLAPWVSDEEEDPFDEPVIWVDWATVWTVQGLEIAQEKSPRSKADYRPPLTHRATESRMLPTEAIEVLYQHHRMVQNDESRLWDKRGAITSPFLLGSQVVLLITVFEWSIAEEIDRVRKKQGDQWAPDITFEHKDSFSLTADTDHVNARLYLPTLSSNRWGDQDLGLYFSFYLQMLQPDPDSPMLVEANLLRQLITQTTIPLYFFPLMATLNPRPGMILTMPFRERARSQAQQMLKSAERFARETRHSEAQWQTTAGHRILSAARHKHREANHLYNAIRTAYRRGLLQEGSAAELAAIASGSWKSPLADQVPWIGTRIQGIGPKRLEVLRTILQDNPETRTLLETQPPPPEDPEEKEWQDTEAFAILTGPLQRGEISQRVYTFIRKAFVYGRIDGTRQTLERAALNSVPIEGIGRQGRQTLRQVLEIPAGTPETEQKPNTFWTIPERCKCYMHYADEQGYPLKEYYEDSDLQKDCPHGTHLVQTEKGNLVICCAECYERRLQTGWPGRGNPGRITETITNSPEGFIRSHQMLYYNCYVPLSGDDAGKAFQSNHRLWREEPPTPVHVLPARLPKDPERQALYEEVIALIAKLPHSTIESAS